MKLTKLWLPYNRQIHSGLRSVVPCNAHPVVVSLKVRNTKGEILQEHWLNHGEPITGVSSFMLDYSVLGSCMKDSGEGLIEETFLSDEPFQGEICHYYLGRRGFTSYLDGPLVSINQSNKPHRYRAFSVHYVDDTVQSTGLLLMNVSTNPHYSQVARYHYDILNKRGEVIRSDSVEIRPFGSFWFFLDENLFKERQEPMYTLFGRCDGSGMISLIYTTLKGGGLGVDHTQPPSAQLRYGEDLNPSLRHRYIRMRERLDRRNRYRFNRFEEIAEDGHSAI